MIIYFAFLCECFAWSSLELMFSKIMYSSFIYSLNISGTMYVPELDRDSHLPGIDLCVLDWQVPPSQVLFSPWGNGVMRWIT